MQKLDVVEVRGTRVLTTRQIADMYGVPKDKIIYNFNYNKSKYILGKHYIEVSGDELRRLKTTCENQMSFKYAKSLYLWTEKGALLHAKSLNTDKAWEVYDYLVDFYFRAKEKQPEVEKTQETVQPKVSGREVVDIPENVKMQKAMQEVRKQLNAMDVIVQEYNKYQCRESYIHLEKVLSNLWISLGRKVTDLMEIEPNLIVQQ